MKPICCTPDKPCPPHAEALKRFLAAVAAATGTVVLAEKTAPNERVATFGPATEEHKH